LPEGQLIDEEGAKLVQEAGCKVSGWLELLLLVKLQKEFVLKCSGLNMAENRLVKPGEPVGIIAAQSIGDPGTQLTT